MVKRKDNSIKLAKPQNVEIRIRAFKMYYVEQFSTSANGCSFSLACTTDDYKVAKMLAKALLKKAEKTCDNVKILDKTEAA